MSIRKAEPADSHGISRLLSQLEYPGTEHFIRDRLHRMLNDPAEILLVWAEPSPAPPLPAPPSPTPTSQSPPASGPQLYPAEALLGFLSLHFIPQIALEGDFARISYFAVDDDSRSQGIGRQLEEAATRLARERGCTLMEVHCHTRRTRAHAFYARQGWTESPKYLIKKL